MDICRLDAEMYSEGTYGKEKAYDNTSISMLKDEERVRKRPAVIFGSDDLEGCKHAVFEILSNAIDEAQEGYGNLIVVTRYEDLSVDVEDYGRGCPVDWNEKEKRYNWELVFCEMYAGGKYDAGGSNYEFSLGLNGLGTCATQYASEYFDAVIRRDGYRYSLHFEKRKKHRRPEKGAGGPEKKTGSYFHWKPDREVFTEIDIPAEYFQDVIRRQAVVNKGITFRFRNQVAGKFEVTEYCYENGITQYLEELAGDDAFTMPAYFEAERRGRDSENRPEMKLKITAAFCFSKRLSHIEYYHNSSWLEHGGSPDKATRSGFVSAFDKYIRETGKVHEERVQNSFQDIQDSLVLVTNCFSTLASFENQTKKSVNSKFIQEAMTAFFRENLQVWFLENKAEADRTVDQILVNKRSRETGRKGQNLHKKEALWLLWTLATGFRNLWIAEAGMCPAGAFTLGGRFRPGLRKAVTGCGVSGDYAGPGQDSQLSEGGLRPDFQKRNHHRPSEGIRLWRGGHRQAGKDLTAFDLGNLRWNKVVICTDADEDGFQIRTLILTMLYRLTPTLIREGYVYIAETPLFEIIYKDKTWFAYNEAEKIQILKGMEGKKPILNRSKGLGENDPEMMWMTTMNPATRRLIKVMPEDAERTAWYFDMLLGNGLSARKDFISENGQRYLELADLS